MFKISMIKNSFEFTPLDGWVCLSFNMITEVNPSSSFRKRNINF